MNYVINTIGGQSFEITEEQRNKLAQVLLSKKEDRPSFIELGKEGKNIISVFSISSITEKKGW